MRVTAIITSHNRRPHTLTCLASFYAQTVEPDTLLDAVLVDDRSTDGTAEAVMDRFHDTEVIVGDGNLFWAGAMAIAEEAALARRPDYLLWLNDDVVLDHDALSRLTATVGCEVDTRIAVGALRDPCTGKVTYSGLRRPGVHPLRLQRIAPAETPVEVDTLNGNVVLVPRSVSAQVGPLDGGLVHAAADLDYGFRAVDAGIRNFLAPGTVGTCRLTLGNRGKPWADSSMPLRQRIRTLLGPKGFPPRARARYLRRHGGPAWIIFWLAPYVRAARSILRPSRAQAVEDDDPTPENPGPSER